MSAKSNNTKDTSVDVSVESHNIYVFILNTECFAYLMDKMMSSFVNGCRCVCVYPNPTSSGGAAVQNLTSEQDCLPTRKTY